MSNWVFVTQIYTFMASIIMSMNTPLERSKELKQALVDFVFDAEGELAVALESFSKDKLERWSKVQAQSQNHSAMAIDMFLNEGKVGDKTPIQCFIDESGSLSEGDCHLLQEWHRSFNGLFEVIQASSDGYDLMNWFTTKTYRVLSNGLQEPAKLSRLKPGEIVLTRISPLTETQWIFSGPMELLGTLGKPKLAVAIGNFKDRFKHHLYGDAPELLEEAWQSVERYHQEFTDFFGGAEVVIPGHEFAKRFQEFQDILMDKQLERAGIDSSKSIQELAAESGVSEEDMEEMVAELDDDASPMTKQLLNSKKSIKMVVPKVDLPKPLQRAEQLTVIVHPRCGPCFLEDYQVLGDRLIQQSDTSDPELLEKLDKQIKRYLEEPTIHFYIWKQLAESYPDALEVGLRRVLQRPDFAIKTDLSPVLETYGKVADPELPETASVPIHLNDLFQDALAEVNQSKSKNKGKTKAKAKAKTGFGVR